MSAAPRLELDGVSVVLDGASVLDGIDLAVADGEVLGVLGPSGSGKSTLLRVVAGLERPSRGRVRLGGVDVTDVPPHRRGVGLMFQDHALFPHRDVAGNVGFGLRVRGAERSMVAARVAETLELVGLSGFERRAVASLSGGERQRVALARALAPEPEVLLLDEPLGSLDRALRERLLDDLVAVLDRAGVTVIHVTHDRAEAFAGADRVALLRGGRLVQVGTPNDLWWRPVDAEAATFVGPATVVDATVGPDGTVVGPWGPVAGVEAPRTTGRGVGPVALVLRPEAVELVAPDDAAAVGRVVGSGVRGDHALVRVAIGGTEVLADARGRSAPGPGDAVGVRVRGDLAIVVPAVGHDGGS